MGSTGDQQHTRGEVNHGAHLRTPDFDAILAEWIVRDVRREQSVPADIRAKPGRWTGYQRARDHAARLTDATRKAKALAWIDEQEAGEQGKVAA